MFHWSTRHRIAIYSVLAAIFYCQIWLRVKEQSEERTNPVVDNDPATVVEVVTWLVKEEEEEGEVWFAGGGSNWG